MPITCGHLRLGYLAIIGFPLFSGFFSKDAIIETAFAGEAPRAWVLGCAALLGAGITALLHVPDDLHDVLRREALGPDGRAPARVARGHDRADDVLLPSARSSLGGFLILGRPVHEVARPVVGCPRSMPCSTVVTPSVLVHALALVAVGAVLAWFRYGAAAGVPGRPARVLLTASARRRPVRRRLQRDAVQRPGQWLTRFAGLRRQPGRRRAVNGLAAADRRESGRLRRIQTGYVRSYALSILFGAAVVVGALLYVGNM